MIEAFDGTRKAGAIASGALDEVAKIIKPGIKTDQIDKLCFDFINDNSAYSAPLFYRGFPKSCCTSTNHIVCHGIPQDKILWEAPQKSQQVWFIKLMGANVNLGNIAPHEIIPLECLRLGLRGDTFYDFLPK